MRPARRRGPLLAMLALGCQPTASIGSTAGAATTGMAEPVDTTAMIGDADDGASTTTTNATSDPSGAPPDLGEGDTSSTDASSESTSGGEPACFPAPFDVPCIECAKQACCDSFAACAEDFACSCTLGCIQYAGPFGCMCPPSALAGALFGCLTPSCDPACGPP